MMDKTGDTEGRQILVRLTKPLVMMRYKPFSDSTSLLVKRN